VLGLAIDSAGRRASAVLFDREGGAVAAAALPPEEGEADQLLLAIERLLEAAGRVYADLDVIAVNRGPGSFTGVRSAVALGRGLALAVGCPTIGVAGPEALAARLFERDGQRLMVALDARRGEVYAQAFGADGEALGSIAAMTPEAAAERLRDGRWRIAGSGAALVAGALGAAVDAEIVETAPIDAADVAKAAAARLLAGEAPAPGFSLQPLYVRAPDAVPPPPLVAPRASAEARV
jgi:tRNA threonylcarbamoyladenosine biosynthesis protein TsaB